MYRVVDLHDGFAIEKAVDSARACVASQNPSTFTYWRIICRLARKDEGASRPCPRGAQSCHSFASTHRVPTEEAALSFAEVIARAGIRAHHHLDATRLYRHLVICRSDPRSLRTLPGWLIVLSCQDWVEHQARMIVEPLSESTCVTLARLPLYVVFTVISATDASHLVPVDRIVFRHGVPCDSFTRAFTAASIRGYFCAVDLLSRNFRRLPTKPRIESCAHPRARPSSTDHQFPMQQFSHIASSPTAQNLSFMQFPALQSLDATRRPCDQLSMRYS